MWLFGGPGRATPSIARTLFELTRLHRALPRRTRGRLLRGPYWTGGDDVDAGWVPGTAMIVRPSAVRDVGNLREDLFIYGEDLEWCWRMRRAGWRVGVCSTATFVHDTSSSARATFGAREDPVADRLRNRRCAAGHLRPEESALAGGGHGAIAVCGGGDPMARHGGASARARRSENLAGPCSRRHRALKPKARQA